MVKKQARKYFVKEEDGIFVVNDDFFSAIESRTEALVVALRSYHMIQDQLVEDAVNGEDSYIGNMKVITGLERTLTKLNEMFPCLLNELFSVARRKGVTRDIYC